MIYQNALKLFNNTLAFLLENATAGPIKSSRTIIFTGLIKYLGCGMQEGSVHAWREAQADWESARLVNTGSTETGK